MGRYRALSQCQPTLNVHLVKGRFGFSGSKGEAGDAAFLSGSRVMPLMLVH